MVDLLGVSGLDRLADSLVGRGVADSTLRSYAAGRKRYLDFCAQFNLQPLPLREFILPRFVAHLASLDLTVRLYLSAICHMQIVSGMSDPALASYARLNYALHGLRRVGGNGRHRARLPITPDILMKIYRQWSHVAQTYDHIMLWAAFCLSSCIQGVYMSIMEGF